MDTKHYSTLIEWNDEDGCYIGSAYPLVGQCCHGETRAEVAGQLETIIEDLLDDSDWLGNVPETLAAKEYSGRITLRVSPEEHKLLAARSASRGLTINRYLKEKALG
ncbi:MAG: toxin-antitoxin system HicB family antitoxin [Gammaproteobacteria bacterium]|nr:toxin-antitoxin system HicB family antitoxin [Gammaproteobacteria bacterium]